jgi:hypothetical protein
VAKTVFYSFHYERDVSRVQLVRNVNALEGQPLLNSQEWEQVRKKGADAVQKWIDGEMAYKKAVIVLIGQETADRPWVKYEIAKAWVIRKPLLGIRIHGLSSFGTTDNPGRDPFPAAYRIPIFDPTVKDIWFSSIDSKATYNKLTLNLETWSRSGVVRP